MIGFSGIGRSNRAIVDRSLSGNEEATTRDQLIFTIFIVDNSNDNSRSRQMYVYEKMKEGTFVAFFRIKFVCLAMDVG